jgi:hypothetical protein
MYFLRGAMAPPLDTLMYTRKTKNTDRNQHNGSQEAHIQQFTNLFTITHELYLNSLSLFQPAGPA